MKVIDHFHKQQLFEGDGLKITKNSKEFMFECCTCGLIHKVKIEHSEGNIILRFHEHIKNG